MSKKYTYEEMKRFIYAFAKMFSKDAMPVLIVELTRTKNCYFIAIKTKQNDVYRLEKAMPYDKSIGTVGKLDTLFKEANSKVLLRPQVIAVEDLIKDFNLDENAVYEALFNKVKSSIALAIKQSYDNSSKMSFRYSCAYISDQFYAGSIPASFGPTPQVSSIDELMVLADMHGV